MIPILPSIWPVLPPELNLRVLGHLQAPDLRRVAVVCRAGNTLAKMDDLWRNLVERDFGMGSEHLADDYVAETFKAKYQFLASPTGALNRALAQAINSKDPRSPTEILKELVTRYPSAWKVTLTYSSTFDDWAGISNETLDVIRQMRTVNGLSLCCLSASRCELVTDAALLALAQAHHELTILELSGCSTLTESGLLQVLEQLPDLQRLLLANYNLVTKKVLDKIASLPHMQSLTLKGPAKNLTPEDLLSLKEKAPYITELEDKIVW